MYWLRLNGRATSHFIFLNLNLKGGEKLDLYIRIVILIRSAFRFFAFLYGQAHAKIGIQMCGRER